MYTFGDIVGNGPIINNLKNAIKRGEAAHAYIIAGGGGYGKMTLAKTAAKALQCENRGEGAEPCLACVSCRTFDSNNHPDVFYVVPTNRKSVGVDDVREQIGENIKTKPYRYKYKIFIIKDADTMTPAAQNALLKTLEEPAGYGIFLLTGANLAGFLPTVLSRSVVLKLRPADTEDIKNYLAGAGFTREEAELYSAYARGSVGKALKYRGDENFAAARDAARKILSEALSPGAVKLAHEAFAAAELLEPFKDDIKEVLGVMQILLRDMLVYKTTGDESALTERGLAGFIIECAGGAGVKELLKKLGAVNDAYVKLRYNANFSMTMDVMTLGIFGIGTGAA